MLCSSAAYIVNVFSVFICVIWLISWIKVIITAFTESLMLLLSVYIFRMSQSQQRVLMLCCQIALSLLSFIYIMNFSHHDRTIYKILNSNVVISNEYCSCITYQCFSHLSELLHLKILSNTDFMICIKVYIEAVMIYNNNLFRVFFNCCFINSKKSFTFRTNFVVVWKVFTIMTLMQHCMTVSLQRFHFCCITVSWLLSELYHTEQQYKICSRITVIYNFQRFLRLKFQVKFIIVVSFSKNTVVQI